jgi:hypothetical protein
MKRVFLLLIMAVIVLTAVNCGGKGTGSAKPVDKLTPADMTDVKAYGFYGKVKSVKFDKHGYFDGLYEFEFDREGKVVSAKAYGGINVPYYVYSDATHYSYDGGKYEITYGTNIRTDVSRDQYSHITVEYKFDSYGRVVSRKNNYVYPMIQDKAHKYQTYTYSGTNAFPTSMEYSEMNSEGSSSGTYEYEYTKFDKYGNWTERIISRDGRKEVTQTAEYTYYE